MQFIGSPNCWPGRQGQTPRWIILHGTAGGSSAVNVANWFANPESKVASHYVIDSNETIQCVDEAAAAWANGVISGSPAILGFRTAGDGIHRDSWWMPGINPNYLTISIEHVKPSQDNSDELTATQANASFALIDAICDRWGIPKRFADSNGGITGHFSMDPVNRSHCPGPYPWAQLWQYLRGGNMVPQGWHDDGVTLTAPNGIMVTQGFRGYVLASNWHKDNWPVEASVGKTPLELSNPSLGGGTRQLFRWTTLEWTPNKGVFVAWTGPEIMALEARIVALTTPPPTTPASAQNQAAA